MKFYSEDLKTYFNTAEECLKEEENFRQKVAAEKLAAEKKSVERKARADKVDAAYAALIAAQKAYKDELTAFCKDYGQYHTSVRPEDIIRNTFFPFF